MDCGLARRLSRAARTTMNAVRGVPRLTVVLAEMRDAVKQIERLATFAAQELPEVIYQLEQIRGQLAEIERRVVASRPADNGRVASRDERRSGSPRPS